MQFISHYESPLGPVLLASNGKALTGLWFEGQKYYALHPDLDRKERELPVFTDVKRWLDIYFSGREPEFSLPLAFIGTDFQTRVWELLCAIPYGCTVTYGQLAKILAAERGLSRFSAQAVGGAVGRNRISVIVPCHRVVGAGGSLTGYAGGTDKKLSLLQLEGADTSSLFIP